MLKAFLKDSAVYGFANMFTRAIQLLLVPLYTRVLAPSDYGSVDMMIVVAAVAMSILTLEVAQGMARAYGDTQDPEARAVFASTALWVTAAAAALLVAVAVLGAPLAPWVLGPGLTGPFQVALLAIAAQLMFNLFLTELRFEMRPAMYGAVSVLFTLVSNVVAVLLVVSADSGVIGVFWGQLVGYLVAGAVAAIATRRAFRLAFDPARAREMLVYSTPLVFSVIGGHVAMLTDRVAIKGYLGLHDVGVYGIGARIASTVGLLLSAFAASLSPLILTRYREQATPRHIARLYRVFLLLMLPILVGLALFSREIVQILATEAYYEAADVIALLSLAVMFSGMNMFTPGMEIARKTRLLAVIMVTTGFLNVGLNVALVPALGVKGSALATLISAGVGFSVAMFASQKLYPVPHRWRILGIAVGIAAVAGLGGIALGRADLEIWLAITVKAVVWLACCGALVLTLLDRDDLQILKDRARRSR